MYKIGDKVETPLGIGKLSYIDSEFAWVSINKTPEIEFDIRHIKPYRTAHEKLIELGYDKIIINGKVIYKHDKSPNIRIYHDNTIGAYEINLELSRILTQYLEELEAKE